MRLGFHFPATLPVLQSNMAGAAQRPKSTLACQQDGQAAGAVRPLHGIAPPASNVPSPWASIDDFVNAARVAGAL